MQYLKKLHSLARMALLPLLLSACTKLNVPVQSEITPGNFPKTQEDFIALSGPAYNFLQYKYYTIDQVLIQELMGDGAVLTANGGNWYDNSRYKNYHLHKVAPDERFISEIWTAWYNGVSKINSILPLLQSAQESTFKHTTIAEMRTLRALFYFLLMDDFGDVPLVTQFGPDAKPMGRSKREEVFNFIEKEVKESLPDLRTETGVTTYSKPTQWMAYALLSKLYINAAVYTGKTKWDEAVAACDKIIQEAQANGKIALDADYMKMFDYDNGPQIKDFLFAIPCDPYQNPEQIPARYWLHPSLRAKYGLPFDPSGCVRAWPEYYAKFANSPGDARTKMWLTGKQFNNDGSPLIIKTTKAGLDNSYAGSDGSTPVDYQLEFTPDIKFRDLSTFETGNDQLGRAVGYRVNKFNADKTSPSRNQNNDMPIFRYADILLIKAEAILRGAAPTLGQTPVSLANMVRTRAKAVPYTEIDLPELLNERARELAFEGWRKNDLIRFGEYEKPWGVKTNTDIRMRVLPIPADQLVLNPLLIQNDGY